MSQAQTPCDCEAHLRSFLPHSYYPTPVIEAGYIQAQNGETVTIRTYQCGYCGQTWEYEQIRPNFPWVAYH